MFQVGTGTTTTSNPFGLLYSGDLARVSAPATLMLVGLALGGLALLPRGRRSPKR